MAAEDLPEGQENEKQFHDGSHSKGGLIRLLAVLVGVILIGSTVSLVVWRFVLQPRLADPEPVLSGSGPVIPPEPFMVPFEPALATVVMPSDGYRASTLMYAVELECSD